MDLNSVRKMIADCKYDLPLTWPPIKDRLILATEKSDCCRSDSLLVRSRDGGYVSRNCLKCGRPAHVAKKHIPYLNCNGCLKDRGENSVEFILKADNYWGKCEVCLREWELAEIIPPWHELFESNGLVAPGDLGFQR